jgi:hypothetical protein
MNLKINNYMKTKNLLIIPGWLTAMAIMIACSGEDKALLDKFVKGNSKVSVCPVHILSNQESSFDTLISKKIVEYLNDKKYAVAGVTQLCPPANNEWRANEAGMLTISNQLFIDFVKKQNLPDDTYILYPEFLKSGPDNSVKAVHYCLLNRKGEIVMRGLINSHWDEFKKVNPKTDEDCLLVFINGFEAKIKNNQ